MRSTVSLMNPQSAQLSEEDLSDHHAMEVKDEKDLSTSYSPQSMCKPSKMFELLSESEPDDEDNTKENLPSLPPIRPPTPPDDEHDQISHTSSDHKKTSPNRRPADRLSLSDQDTSSRKRPRLRLGKPNAAMYLQRARREAISKQIPGILHPEEYDPDHHFTSTVSKMCEEKKPSPRIGRLRLVPRRLGRKQMTIQNENCLVWA